jgi:hypothetical protein
MRKGERRDIGNIQNAAHHADDKYEERRMPQTPFSASRPPPYFESGSPPAPFLGLPKEHYCESRPPQVLYSESGYEQPVLDSSLTVPDNASLQSLRVHENLQQYAPYYNVSSNARNEVPEETIYEELP